MYIESIQLRDWKSYVDETFRFPRPTRNKNVVLVGAENGYGKTSLLESAMLCLYGRDGLQNIPRATVVDGDDQRLDLSYDEFLRRAFHGCALQSGRTSASVTITINNDGQQIKICRQWYFAGNGRHRASEEEVRIYVDDEPFKAGRLEDKQDAFNNYIAKAFVPVFLAPFFLFDGEQVQRLANKDMAAQVRIGIEGLLGVGTLRELQGDLRNYAMNRRSGTAKDSNNNLETLQGELRTLLGEQKACQSELHAFEPQLPIVKQAKEAKVRQLSSVAGGNSATIRELYDQRSHAESSRITLRERLLGFLHSDLALTIAGSKLRKATLERLKSEERRESWASGKAQGET